MKNASQVYVNEVARVADKAFEQLYKGERLRLVYKPHAMQLEVLDVGTLLGEGWCEAEEAQLPRNLTRIQLSKHIRSVADTLPLFPVS